MLTALCGSLIRSRLAASVFFLFEQIAIGDGFSAPVSVMNLTRALCTVERCSVPQL